VAKSEPDMKVVHQLTAATQWDSQ